MQKNRILKALTAIVLITTAINTYNTVFACEEGGRKPSKTEAKLLEQESEVPRSKGAEAVWKRLALEISSVKDESSSVEATTSPPNTTVFASNEKTKENTEKTELKKEDELKVESKETKKDRTYYEIPLSHELQDWVYDIVKKVRDKCKNGELYYLDDFTKIKIEKLPKEFDVEMIFAMIRAESTFVSTAGQNGGYKGYMQLSATYFKLYYNMAKTVLGIELKNDIWNEKTNIAVGIVELATVFRPSNKSQKLTMEEMILCYIWGNWGADNRYFKKGLGSSSLTQKRMRYRQQFLDGTLPKNF